MMGEAGKPQVHIYVCLKPLELKNRKDEKLDSNGAIN